MIVWREAIQLNTLVFQMSGALPSRLRFVYADQMQRASLSIASNIAEGYGRSSRAELRRFCRISFGSAMELETQLCSLEALGSFPDPKLEHVQEKLNLVLRLLYGFIQSL